jgi:hypothetical protein
VLGLPLLFYAFSIHFMFLNLFISGYSTRRFNVIGDYVVKTVRLAALFRNLKPACLSLCPLVVGGTQYILWAPSAELHKGFERIVHWIFSYKENCIEICFFFPPSFLKRYSGCNVGKVRVAQHVSADWVLNFLSFVYRGRLLHSSTM